MDRRHFIKMSALGSLVAAGHYSTQAYDASEGSQVYRQPLMDVPMIEESDVVVCGGGPAGIAAAIAAARRGASVRLLELHGFLGGGCGQPVWSTTCLIVRTKPG